MLHRTAARTRAASIIVTAPLLATAPAVFWVAPARAAGYGLHEFSTAAVGTAFAGSAATGSDATFQAYNPAATGAVKDADMALAASAILIGSSAHYTTALTSAGTPAGGNADPKAFITSAVAPAFGARLRLTDQLSLGLAGFTPWALTTNYAADSAPRYYAEKTRLVTFDLVPSLAYAITPAVTLGVGVQAEYAKGTLSNAVDVGTLAALNKIPGAKPGQQDGSATLSAVNWAVGYSFGAQAQLSDQLRLGVSYVSSLHHRFNGVITFQPDAAGLMNVIGAATGLFKNGPAKAEIDTPDIVRAGASFDLSPAWTAKAELDWTGWSNFKNLTVTAANPAQPPDILAGNWTSTWMESVGVDYHPDSALSWRAGLAFDPSPIPDATLSPRIPDGDRVLLGLGASYKTQSGDELALGYSHLFVRSRQVAQTPAMTGNALRGALAGTSNVNANVISVQFNHQFQ
jgi:long-chain fatty acid transport protein